MTARGEGILRPSTKAMEVNDHLVGGGGGRGVLEGGEGVVGSEGGLGGGGQCDRGLVG